MPEISPNVRVITTNVHELTYQLKDRLIGWIETKDPAIFTLEDIHLK